MARTVAAVVLAGWITEAVALGFAMGRRGFDRRAWTAIAVSIGPLSLPVALHCMRKTGAAPSEVLHGGSGGGGGIDVLVGIDGSPESASALRRVQSLLGPRIGRLTLAQVIPIDAAPEAERQARLQLAAAAAATDSNAEATQLVLRGRPVNTLRDYANRLGYELLVVGTRGEGKARGFAGSVATGLARGSGVPVLLVDADGSEIRWNSREQALAHSSR